MRKIKGTGQSIAACAALFGIVSAACNSGQEDVLVEDVQSKTSLVTSSFDWSMTPRTVLDDSNNLIPVEVAPSTFSVHFTACAAEANPARAVWDFGDGKSETTSSCEIAHAYPSEGGYTVTLTITDASGATATSAQDITIQDFLIVGFGDSYGSGEGAPNVEIPPSLVQDWLTLGAELGQAELDRSRATEALRMLDDVLGPAEKLATAMSIRDAVSCSTCFPDDFNFDEIACFITNAAVPGICWLCKSNCRDAAENVTIATAELVAAVVKVTAVSAFEHLKDFAMDPSGISQMIEEIQRLKGEAEATWSALEGLVATLKGEQTVFPQKAKRAKWNDQQCHRSSFSAQAQTALALEALDAKSSVTFVHLACSGAKIGDILNPGYKGIVEGDPLPAQVTAAAEIVGAREVDAVLLSIGGNDAKFEPIIKSGIFQEPTYDPVVTNVDLVDMGVSPFCTATAFFSDECFEFFESMVNDGLGGSGTQLLQQGLATLPGGYEQLSTRLKETFGALNRDPARILITEYPNATEDERGEPCSPRADRLPKIQNLLGWTSPEWEWARDTVIPSLNGAVATAATTHSWSLVDGIFGAFHRHGLCSDDNWINLIQESFLQQGDGSGIAHPNRAGYAAIAQRQTDVLKARLFSGPLGTVRPPAVPPIADAGPPIVLNEGQSHALTNLSFDPGRAPSVHYNWALSIAPADAAALTSTDQAFPVLFARDDGAGQVNLTVATVNGGDSSSTPIQILNVAPAIHAGPDLNGTIRSPIQALVTFTDPGLWDSHVVRVNWGDGSVPEEVPVVAPARELGLSHTYAASGTYNVEVIVRDDDGGEGRDSLVISVLGQEAFFGFETPGIWSSPEVPVTIASSPRSQGNGGLAVSGQGFVHIASVPFPTAALSGVTNRLAYDLYIPPNPPNRYWVGQTQLFISCPSAGINNQFIGFIDLTGRPLGAFSTMAFTLPSNIVAMLRGNFPDLSITIAVNANRHAQPFVLDNLRFL